MSTTAYITPAVIEWARMRANLSLDELAYKLHVPPENVAEWESGKKRPSLSKAEAIAARLRIPFGYLFLSQLPEDDVPLPDLRTVSGERPENPSLDFIEVVQSTLLKQQWFSEYMQESHATRLPFVGTARLGGNVKRIAEDMRRALGIDSQMRSQCSSWEQFKTEFVRRAESIGVLVMQSGVAGSNTRRLSVHEFRGFAIIDNFAPTVFINARDAKGAKIFTLAHELAHIWLGESGVSNPDPRKRSTEEMNRVEQFCNKVASEVLVPSEGLSQTWIAKQSINQNVNRLVRIYRVSKYVVARQAYELDRITRPEYFDYLEQHKKLWRPQEDDPEDSDDESGGNFYLTFAVRNSRRLIAGVARALGENRISFRDASSLLGVKIATLKKVADRLG